MILLPETQKTNQIIIYFKNVKKSINIIKKSREDQEIFRDFSEITGNQTSDVWRASILVLSGSAPSSVMT